MLILLLAAATLVAVPLVIALALWQYRQLKLREMVHRERIAAVEKGLEIPDAAPAWMRDPGDGEQGLYWLRVVSLGLALLFFFAGGGMIAGLKIADDQELANMWTLGLIPIMISGGLLLFFVTSRWVRRNGDRVDS